MSADRISREAFIQRAHDELRAALDDDLLTQDQLRAILEILTPIAWRPERS